MWHEPPRGLCPCPERARAPHEPEPPMPPTLLLYPCLHSHEAPLPYTGLSLGRNQALSALLPVIIKITFCIR